MSFQTKFTFMWTRTSRRSPPLYAKTLTINHSTWLRHWSNQNCAKGKGIAGPPEGANRPLIPPTPPACLPNGDKKTRSHEGTGFFCSNLLECDLCASCFESCLCLVCCLLVCLLKKGSWSCIDEILSFLKTKCRVEVTYFLDNRNLL